MSTAIRFENVSRKFTLHHERSRSFQEMTIGLLRRRNGSREEFWALKEVNFTVLQGETIGIIGPNGGGKSTALKLMARILEPTSGRVSVQGQVGALLELGAGFHPDLTGRENIYLNGSIMGLGQAQIRQSLDEIIAFAELERFIDAPVKHYSSGMYVRLGFAIAVQVQPQILLVDEILAVGDQLFQKKCLERISKLKRDGTTIVLVSHGMGDVWNLCKRVIWLQDGKLEADGVATEVIDQYLNFSNQQYREQVNKQAALEKKHEQAGPGAPSRWGSHEIEIVQVELVDAAGQSCQVFRTNQPLAIRLHYQARQPIHAPVFGVAIYHENSLHITGPNTKHSKFQIGTLDGCGVVELTIDCLPLLQGRYNLSVAVYDDTLSHPYDHHERLYSFIVETGSLGELFGNFYFPCRWRLEDGTQRNAGKV